MNYELYRRGVDLQYRPADETTKDHALPSLARKPACPDCRLQRWSPRSMLDTFDTRSGALSKASWARGKAEGADESAGRAGPRCLQGHA